MRQAVEQQAKPLTGVDPAIACFLHGIQTADWDGIESHLAEDVFYDASVPGWRYQYEGAGRLAEQYADEWTGKHVWILEEYDYLPTPDGAVVTMQIRGRCPGDADHAEHDEVCRLANVFRLQDGKIAEHRFYCCGEWDEETVARIEAEAPKVERTGR